MYDNGYLPLASKVVPKLLPYHYLILGALSAGASEKLKFAILHIDIFLTRCKDDEIGPLISLGHDLLPLGLDYFKSTVH